MGGDGEHVAHMRKYWQMSEKLCAVTRLFLINNLNAISNLEEVHIFFFFFYLQLRCRHHQFRTKLYFSVAHKSMLFQRLFFEITYIYHIHSSSIALNSLQ